MVLPPIFILVIGMLILSLIVSWNVKAKFKKYSKQPLQGNLTGKDVAEMMLRDNGIYDVKVLEAGGMGLSDHYNPQNQTVNLSKNVYHGNNVAAAAIAAHECGHAVQHATAYKWLTMRSTLVPIVGFASNWVQWIILAGILLIETFPNLMLIGIILFAVITLFSFITLPVEIDASKRALVWLQTANITSVETQPMAGKALRAAAYTYVVAALSSLATLLYYITIFLGNRN